MGGSRVINEKSTSFYMGGSGVELNTQEKIDLEESKLAAKIEQAKIAKQTQEYLKSKSEKKVTRRLSPIGSRVLVKRRTTVDIRSVNGIILPEHTDSMPTDYADVIAVPDRTLVDDALLKNSQAIIDGLAAKANAGDPAAVEALIKFNEYLWIMTMRVGDVVMLARYGGTDISINDGISEKDNKLTVTDFNGIYALVKEKTIESKV